MRPNDIPSNRVMSQEKTKFSLLPEILRSWSAYSYEAMRALHRILAPNFS